MRLQNRMMYVGEYEAKSVLIVAVTGSKNNSICCNIYFTSSLFMTDRGRHRDVREPSMTKTTFTDIRTSYPDHIPLALRIYLGG